MIEYEEFLKKKCPEHLFVYRYKVTSSGYLVVRKQCDKCDYILSESPKKKDIKDFDLLVSTGEIKEILPDDNWKEYEMSRQLKINEQRLNQKEKYNEYLKSEKWYNIRKLVLKRDNFLCQGCLESEATEVHHKNYVHLFDEILFDLVSVCKSCHIKIHKQ